MSDEALPDGWVETTLGEAFSWRSGGTPSRANPDYFDGPIPWAVIGDLTDGQVTKTTGYISEEGLLNSAARWVKPGAVLLAMYGASIGRLGIAKAPLTTNQAIAFTVPSEISSEYLFWYLNARKNDLINLGQGAAQKNISLEIIRGFPFLLPPLAEQARVVEEIERLLTRIDSGVASLKRIQANLRRYRAAVLKASCEGRLVPTEAELARAEGRGYEPAKDFINGLLQSRRVFAGSSSIGDQADRTNRYREPQRLAELSLHLDLPEGWAWATVEQLCFVESGQTPSGIDQIAAVSGSIPWFRISDMNLPANSVYMRDSQCWLREEDARALKLRVKPAGTIIFPKRGGAIATNKKRITATPSCYDLNTMGLIPIGPVGDYFWWWFMGIDLARLSDGSNVPQINHGDIAYLKVPLPPYAEQIRITRELELIFSSIEALENATRAQMVRALNLRRSILKRGFEGRLVPQDPSAEPASVLLERIRQARASQCPEPRARKERRKKLARELPLASPEPVRIEEPPPATEPELPESDFLSLLRDEQVEIVWGGLFGRGEVEKDLAIRDVADELRTMAYARFKRLRQDGPLYRAIAAAIERGVREGSFDRPRRGYVRAMLRDPKDYTSEDWRWCLLEVIGAEAGDMATALRAAAETAREAMGLEFARLREDGVILTGLREALADAVRAGELVRKGGRVRRA